MKNSKTADPKPSEMMGCTLFIVSASATALFGVMALGSFMPEVARIGFAVAAFALVAAGVLVSLLGFFAHLRAQEEPPQDEWTLRGDALTKVGEGIYGVKRMFAEPDKRYRRRIMDAMKAQIRSQNPK